MARCPYIDRSERTAAASDWHLAPMPGTDAALALGLLHVVLTEGKEDREFIGGHTVGWDEFRARILEFPPLLRSPGFPPSPLSIWANGSPILGRPAFASALAFNVTAAVAWPCGRLRAFPA